MKKQSKRRKNNKEERSNMFLKFWAMVEDYAILDATAAMAAAEW